jgi:RNA polymerase sigma-70 factor (ECF subfamily)
VGDFDDVFREHLDYVWRLARLHVGDADADDVAQEVFVVVRRRLATFVGGSIRAWLYGITRNVARNHRRGRSRYLRAVSDAPEPSMGVDADVHMQRLEAAAVIDAFLERLPDVKREAFVLHVIEGLTAAEIGQAIGVPERTVFSRVRSAQAELVRFLERRQLAAARSGG